MKFSLVSCALLASVNCAPTNSSSIQPLKGVNTTSVKPLNATNTTSVKPLKGVNTTSVKPLNGTNTTSVKITQPTPTTKKPAGKADFTSLQSALASKFVTASNLPVIVRMSFHDLLNFDKATGSAGAQGCIFDQRVASFAENKGLNATAQALKSFVEAQFPNTSFSSGDIVSLAGKVAVEKAFPCIKIQWRFGRQSCKDKELEEGPPPSISSLSQMQPFLDRYGLSALEMAVLTSGAHGVAGAVNDVDDSGIFSFQFATISSGFDFIQKTFNTPFASFGTWYGDAANPLTGKARGRFPSDMLFFPSVLKKIPSAPVDNSTTIAQVETALKKHTEPTFNAAFGQVYAKMLEIGTRSDLTPFSTGSATC